MIHRPRLYVINLPHYSIRTDYFTYNNSSPFPPDVMLHFLVFSRTSSTMQVGSPNHDPGKRLRLFHVCNNKRRRGNGVDFKGMHATKLYSVLNGETSCAKPHKHARENAAQRVSLNQQMARWRKKNPRSNKRFPRPKGKMVAR